MLSPTFFASSLVVIMTPGPDLALITRLVLSRGRFRPVLAAAVGMITAGAAQLVVGAFGMAALLAADPAMFAVLRWAGAVVLIGMAVPAVRSALRRPVPGEPSDAEPPAGRAFLQGLLCTGTNPKVGLFLMAFLPQFVPSGMDPVRGLLLLAAVYLGMGLLWLLIWTATVRRLARFVHAPAVSRTADWFIAAVFTLFAVRLSFGG